MMILKKILLITTLLFAFTIILNAPYTYAQGNLDSYQKSTDNWNIELNKTDKKSEIPNAQIYDLTITNKNQDLEEMRFEVYRSLDNESKYATLYSGPMVTELKKGNSTGFYDFPLKNNTTALHITIHWKEEGRDYKEMFQVEK